MAKIQVGELTFATKAAAEAHFQEILYRYDLSDSFNLANGNTIINEGDTRELYWLLERHPDYEQKRGVGIVRFSVGRASFNNRHFLVHRSDGTWTDLSYKKCLNGAPSNKTRVEQALRKEVEADILRAKLKYFVEHGDALGRVPCAKTNELVTVNEAHADHAPPYTFKVLTETFLTALRVILNIDPNEAMVTGPADNQHGRTLADRKLADAWRAFHHALAHVRIIAKTKHLTMSQENRAKADDRQLILEIDGDSKSTEAASVNASLNGVSAC
jgi:hypothetical protein